MTLRPTLPLISQPGTLKLSNVKPSLLFPSPHTIAGDTTLQPDETSNGIMSQDHEYHLHAELEDSDGYDLPPLPPRPEPSGSTDSVDLRQHNLQWKPSSRTVEEKLAEGLSNEDLWLLIRRFNKVCPT